MSIADKLTTIAENMQGVYNSGIEQGKQDAYDEFCDTYEKHRNGWTEYMYAGSGWVDSNFKPKYNMRPIMATAMFYMSGIRDLKGILEKRGLSIDFSQAQSMGKAFAKSKITRLPKIDLSNATYISEIFDNCTNLKSIDEIVFKDDGSQSMGVILNCPKLTDVKCSGVIGKSINFSSSPLTVESAKSVIAALKDYMGTDKEHTYKLTLKSEVWSALNKAEKPPSGGTWKGYVYSLGWNYA